MNEKTEQPMPQPGEGDVMWALADLVMQRRIKGIETYGRSLQIFNGRSAERDLVEELVDAAAYALQARQERAKLETRVEALTVALSRISQAIVRDAKDTVWVDDVETVVDFIELILKGDPTHG